MGIKIIDKPSLTKSSYSMNTPLGTAQKQLLPVTFELESVNTETYCLKIINPNTENRNIRVEYTVTPSGGTASSFVSSSAVTVAVVSEGDAVSATVRCEGFISSPAATYSVPVYATVTVNKTSNGTVTASADRVKIPGTVTLTATADEGYELSKWQFSEDGKKWKDISGATETAYVAELSEGGIYYYQAIFEAVVPDTPDTPDESA